MFKKCEPKYLVDLSLLLGKRSEMDILFIKNQKLMFSDDAQHLLSLFEH